MGDRLVDSLIVGATVAAECATHLGCRYFLGEERYRNMDIWTREAIGTGILLAPALTFAITENPDSRRLAGVIGASALGTGVSLLALHRLQERRENGIYERVARRK